MHIHQIKHQNGAGPVSGLSAAKRKYTWDGLRRRFVGGAVLLEVPASSDKI